MEVLLPALTTTQLTDDAWEDNIILIGGLASTEALHCLVI